MAFARLTDSSPCRARPPWADAPNSGDGVAHNEAGLRPIGNGNLSFGRDVDLCVPGHQIPDARAGFYRGLGINDYIRVDPYSGLSRDVERDRERGGLA